MTNRRPPGGALTGSLLLMLALSGCGGSGGNTGSASAPPDLTDTATTDAAAGPLPSPVVVADGTDWTVLPASQEQVSSLPDVALVLSAADGTQLGSFARGSRIPIASVHGSLTGATWSWRLPSGVASRETAALSFLGRTDLGYWGAMAFADTNNDGTGELLGSLNVNGTMQPVGYGAIGLATLFDQRVFRDVRIVDLNNDGINDIVSNVYNGGCTLIGVGQPGGGYAFQTPQRADGSCIGGHGETILIADFDGDGLVDIVLPSYERLDYLKNMGNGVFVEQADQRGLSLPAYRPTFEGAAAVDIDLNGTVDIVLGGEVMLNDGTGHFTRVSQPFQTTVMQDEGLSVADVDGDGVYDVVKLHPFYGLRMFWGQPDRIHFIDAGYLNGGAAFPAESDGLATGYFTGNSLPDIFIAGGDAPGTPPQLCTPTKARTVTCLHEVVPAAEGQTQDLLMVSDVDGDGQPELVSRSVTIKIDHANQRSENRFRFDVKDAAGRRTEYGRSMRATCASDGQLLQLNFVNGGNGYLAQSDYITTFVSPTCTSVWLDVATPQGFRRYGPYPPGLYGIQLAS